jgi:hypothetical protein
MYGVNLGGASKNQSIQKADFDCNAPQTYAVVPAGIELRTEVPTDNANPQSVAIGLKFAGSITAQSDRTNISANLNWVEYYTLYSINGTRNSPDAIAFTEAGSSNTKFYKPFDYAGEKTFPDYETYANQYIYDVSVPHCGNNKQGKVFVGQRKESFYINLGAIFDLINFIPIPGFPGAIQNNYGNNDLAQKNIGTFALEVPSECLSADGSTNGIIGAWTVTRQLLHDASGNHVPGAQVSRLGHPLINELIIGLRDKYLFNAGDPVNDVTNFGAYVLYPYLPVVVDLLFGAAVRSATGLTTSIAPQTPRNDLLGFVTGFAGLNQPNTNPVGEFLRLNMGIAPVAQASQNSFGVLKSDTAGFPNGRRPGDDIVDIAMRVLLAGALLCPNKTIAPIFDVELTDGAPIAATDFDNFFPYLKTPLPGALNAGKNLSSSPSAVLTLPSLVAIAVALFGGFFISFAFFA